MTLATELQAYVEASRHCMFQPMFVLEKLWLKRWASSGKFKYAIADTHLIVNRYFRSWRRNRVAMASARSPAPATSPRDVDWAGQERFNVAST